MNEQIVNKLKLMPTTAGVYIMKDVAGKIIYVGKAKNLKRRVSSYFNRNSKTVKVSAMIEKIYDLDYILCKNELDALAMESNLIKEYMPYYNILLKDGKQYPYIRVGINEPFGRVEVVRKVEKDNAKYFGPYININAGMIVELINTAFSLADCGYKIEVGKTFRPCINYEIGICQAPCNGQIKVEDYKKSLEIVCDFLNGEISEIKKLVENKMYKASEVQNFELAIKMRDYLKFIDRMQESVIAQLTKKESYDIFAVCNDGSNGAIAIGVIRNGKNLGIETKTVENELDEQLDNIIINYYEQRPIPNVILVGSDVSDSLSEYLTKFSGHSVKVIKPIKGQKKKLVDIVFDNCKQHFIKISSALTYKYNRTIKACEELASELKLNKKLTRIECYDISHISGTYKVGSMVVFINGEPCKSHYRKFKIKHVEGNNDFESLKEVLNRRLTNIIERDNDVSLGATPDMIIIDGGKGQLSSVMEIVDKYPLLKKKITFISLAKRIEEVFLPNNSEPIVLPHTFKSLQMLQRIRDEAHRFAITFHRSLRGKGMLKSILDDIDGIGIKRKNELIKHFKSLDELLSASEEDFILLHGFNKSVSQKLYNSLHKNN